MVKLAASRIGATHRDVIDVDLRAQGENVPAVEFEASGRAAGAAGERIPVYDGLAHQAQLYQFADQPGNGRWGQARAGGDRRPRVGPDHGQMAQHHLKIVTPDIAVTCRRRD